MDKQGFATLIGRKFGYDPQMSVASNQVAIKKNGRLVENECKQIEMEFKNWPVRGSLIQLIEEQGK
jgi:hypothetical protein